MFLLSYQQNPVGPGPLDRRDAKAHTLFQAFGNGSGGERDDGEAGYVHRLVVARSYGGRGIGGELLDWAADYIRERGKRWLRLDCMADNERLNVYYRGAGLRYVGRVDRKRFSASLFERELLRH
ncbi:GNAT family N-acetyltransferase [Paenibacillus ginsengarvi]|nr:GNAT family N-acetyltransferase [Paenibacillus ginsengarvi]